MTDSDLQAMIARRTKIIPSVKVEGGCTRVSFEKYGRDASYEAGRAVIEAMKPRKLKKPFSVAAEDDGSFHFSVELIFEGD